MEPLQELIGQVAAARQHLVHAAADLSDEQANFKPSDEAWSIVNIIEHLVWAELGGLNKIWMAFEGIQSNNPVWTGEAIHRGLSIEDIVGKTLPSKIKSPEKLLPVWGGSIRFWIVTFQACQAMLEVLGNALNGADLENIIYPHPFSGPLDVLQRMGLLRMHMTRHLLQIENIKSHPDYPKSIRGIEKNHHQ